MIGKLKKLRTLKSDLEKASNEVDLLNRQKISLDNEIINSQKSIKRLEKIKDEVGREISRLRSQKKELFDEAKEILNSEMESERKAIIDSARKNEEKIMEAVANLEKTKKILEQEIISIEDTIEMESFGLFKPRYDFASSLTYKAELEGIRNNQKQMIKDNQATFFSDSWTVDGSLSKGKKMTNDNIKQILRSFNNECEAAITKVKYSNLAQIEKRIMKSFEQLNKLNESVRVSIRPGYLDLKLQELNLAYEYERKKQDEKEELRAQRELEREEKAFQKEIQSKKKIIDKDITHYKNMVKELEAKLKSATDDKFDIQQQIAQFEAKMTEKENEKDELDYRKAHAFAGYVYIISNIGAFGEDVFKIGVTRRLEPLERINELSSASVPFKFDVHALIFSHEAYQLENELHQHFNEFRINKVNNRKEFFKVPLSEIEKKLLEYKEVTIDFVKTPDAEEYRQSLPSN
ncbi:hypothetical protein IGJ83_002910 [Enterococcus pernyi]